MSEIFNFINTNIYLISLVLIVVTFILLVLTIVLIISVNKQKKRIESFFGSRTERHNIEQMLLDYHGRVDAFDAKYEECMALIDNINERMTLCVQKVGIVRYNPFDSMGGDQSFSLALLDQHNDGVVVSTLHGREGSYTYAKPINDLKSTYILTVEENEAIKKAVNWKPLVNDV